MNKITALEALSRILAEANRGADRGSFFRAAVESLVALFGCDRGLLWFLDNTVYRSVRSDVVTSGSEMAATENGRRLEARLPEAVGSPAELVRQLNKGYPPPRLIAVPQAAVWWIDDRTRLKTADMEAERALTLVTRLAGRDAPALLVAAFDRIDGSPGMLVLANGTPDRKWPARMARFHKIAPLFQLAVANWQASQALGERVKELTCLYRMARIDAGETVSLEALLGQIAAIVSDAFLHSDDAKVHIRFDGLDYGDHGPFSADLTLASDIVVEGSRRGWIEVAYTAEHMLLDEGPFLKEERRLLDTIARELSQVIAQKDFERQKAEMRDRLAHTDRLNMMGQLSAAIAHEINEPLTAILGYAQLAGKCAGLPAQASADIGRIAATSLHAREVVRKSLLFSRKVAAKPQAVSVNTVLRESLSFFEFRCKKDRITIATSLASKTGRVEIDPAQLRQVFSNLILNALQAMSRDGRLGLLTRIDSRWVRVVIEDNGCGMTPQVREKMFIPFFTTKPHHQGTGLGLPVVQDIVSGAGGTIRVTSTPGAGTRIEIDFPRAPRGCGDQAKAA